MVLFVLSKRYAEATDQQVRSQMPPLPGAFPRRDSAGCCNMMTIRMMEH